MYVPALPVTLIVTVTAPLFLPDSNGGGIMLCLKNVAGDAGGYRTGGDSADIIMPVRADHRSYTGNAFPDRPIPCARCLYSKTCYLEVGIDGCQARGCECLTAVFFDPTSLYQLAYPKLRNPTRARVGRASCHCAPRCRTLCRTDWLAHE